jgi:hypothetical protein
MLRNPKSTPSTSLPGIPMPRLACCLAMTSNIESPNLAVRCVGALAMDFRDETMVRRRPLAGFLEAEPVFRRQRDQRRTAAFIQAIRHVPVHRENGHTIIPSAGPIRRRQASSFRAYLPGYSGNNIILMSSDSRKH